MSTDVVKQARDSARAAGQDAGVEVKDDDSIIVTPESDPDMTALQVLLSAKPVRQQRHLKIRKRNGLPQDLHIVVQSLTDRQFKAIGEEAETPTGSREARRRAVAQAKETDNNLFLRLIVAHAIVDPNFNSPEVLAAHEAISSEQVVSRVFLPGEIAKVAEEVMDLSGWSDDAVELVED